MYSLDINFLSDRPEFSPEQAAAPTAAVTPTANPVPAIAGLLVAIALPAASFGAKVYLEGQRNELTAKRDGLQTELTELTSQLSQVDALKQEEAGINAQIESLVAVFGKVQPMSALVQEVGNRTPGTVRVNTLNITVPTLTLSGTAASYADLTDFVLILKKSTFLLPETVKITSSALGGNPLQVEVQYLEDLIAAQTAEGNPDAPPVPTTPEEFRPKVNYQQPLPEVVSYSITAELSLPNAVDVLDELRALGANGVVDRIEVLQQRGII